MSLIRKAFTDVFAKISKRFKYVLTAGIALFGVQLIIVAALYVAYLTSNIFNPELKYIAEAMTRNALSFITIISIICITGDYIIYGEQ
jgi:hypothetical protein